MLINVDTIYVDSLLAVNLTADYLLLLAAGRLAGAVLRRGRIFLAAALGALFALAAAVPGLGFFAQPAAKIAEGLALALVAFGRERRFFRCAAAFFGVSALFGGALWALSLAGGYDGAGALAVPLNPRVLALSFALCYAALSLFYRRGAAKRAREFVTLSASLAGRSVELSALVDTGCALADPITNRPAAVCEAAALEPLIGRIDPADPAGAAAKLASSPALAGRVSLLPYSAVGGGGLLCAVRPDSAAIDGRPAELLLAVTDTLDGAEAIVPSL